MGKSTIAHTLKPYINFKAGSVHTLVKETAYTAPQDLWLCGSMGAWNGGSLSVTVDGYTIGASIDNGYRQVSSISCFIRKGQVVKLTGASSSIEHSVRLFAVEYI